MKIKKQIRKVLNITIAWTCISIFNYLIGLAAVMDANYIWDANYDIGKINHWHGISISLVTAIIAGILGGSAIVFLWEKWLRTKPYGWTLRSIFISYLIIFNLVAAPVILFNNSFNQPFGPLSNEALEELKIAYSSPSLLVPFAFWLIIVLLTLVAFQVNDKYGPGVFRKFLLGKYFNPTREERIFMFLDLRSSTSIAEKLGEEDYFYFLKDAFSVLTPGILKFNGEIYQYVGDEIVISWASNKAFKNTHCIECFFEIQSLLIRNKDFFEHKYGVHPEFKAGIHYGNVMAGEIGVIKREIAYSGDVLNTTARIQSKCNEFGVDILISSDLKTRLSLQKFNVSSLGKIDLRGKSDQLELFTVKS